MNRVNNDVRTRNVNTTNDLNDNQNKNNNWAWFIGTTRIIWS